MTFSIKEIRSKLGSRYMPITYMGWVESNGHLLGRLFRDHRTGKIYFKTRINSSSPSYKEIITYRMKFLSKFRYTQQLSYFNRYFDTITSITELHGFRKDM